jgi:hypothetical protein
MKTMRKKYFVSERAEVEFVALVLGAMFDASGLTPAAKISVLRQIAQSVVKSGGELRLAESDN